MNERSTSYSVYGYRSGEEEYIGTFDDYTFACVTAQEWHFNTPAYGRVEVRADTLTEDGEWITTVANTYK